MFQTTIKRTTMSVCEMGKLLGLKKTESYYLVHKQYFETTMVRGKMRIVISSFEDWYKNQDRYKKVDGPAPGSELREHSYSLLDIASMFAITDDSARYLVEILKLPKIWNGHQIRVPRKAFDQWYSSQSRYRNEEDRAKDQALIDSSMTIPAMGRLLGVDPREAWKIYNRSKDTLVMIRVADRPRITNDSFQKWYATQSRYRLVEAESGKKQETTLQIKSIYTLDEVSEVLNIPERDLYKMVSRGDIDGKRVGRQWYIYHETLQQLSQCK